MDDFKEMIKSYAYIGGLVLAMGALGATFAFVSDPKGSIEYLSDLFNIESENAGLELPDCDLEQSRTVKADNGNVYKITCANPAP
jgi:hypothetical protein